jgi:hypothetical protein
VKQVAVVGVSRTKDDRASDTIHSKMLIVLDPYVQGTGGVITHFLFYMRLQREPLWPRRRLHRLRGLCFPSTFSGKHHHGQRLSNAPDLEDLRLRRIWKSVSIEATY